MGEVNFQLTSLALAHEKCGDLSGQTNHQAWRNYFTAGSRGLRIIEFDRHTNHGSGWIRLRDDHQRVHRTGGALKYKSGKIQI